jgi:hypothetical protein
MRVLIQENTQSKPALSGFSSGKALAALMSLLLACFLALPAYSQNTRVKGHVSDENGQPVAKVSVIVKGTTNGVSGDDNGDFEITAPANGTLVISAVNFNPLEVRINNRQTLSITLNSFTRTENEVVVIGYGT